MQAAISCQFQEVGRSAVVRIAGGRLALWDFVRSVKESLPQIRYRVGRAFEPDVSLEKADLQGSRSMADKPRVSIVIPAYNEAPCLEKLHQELTAACDMLPFHFEFLFVNDGSTDETEEVLARAPESG